MKIVENEGTAANLLVAGDINAAQVIGPDAKRLEAQKLFSYGTPALQGEQWYNHNDGHATSDPAVRMALTQALDLAELASVSTAGAGTPATTLAAIQPVACPGDSVSGVAPGPGRGRRQGRARRQAELTFLYSSAAGSAVAAAAELAVQQWEAAGVKVTAKGVDETALQGAIFGTGDWDIAWVPLNVNSPDQLVPFLSGAGLADGGTNFSGIDNKDYTDGVTAASAMPGTDGCDAWLDAESVAGRRRRPRALRQQRGEDVRQRRRVRDAGSARAHQHPDAGEVVRWHWRARRRRRATRREARLPRVAPVRRTPPRAPAGLAVGAGHGVVPDDPPDPGRPGARGPRPDGTGRPGRGQARGDGSRRPDPGAVLALPAGPLHR